MYKDGVKEKKYMFTEIIFSPKESQSQLSNPQLIIAPYTANNNIVNLTL